MAGEGVILLRLFILRKYLERARQVNICYNEMKRMAIRTDV